LSIPDLRRSIAGLVVTSDDADYDTMRQLMYGGFDKHPAAIVCPVNATDIATAIKYARDNGLELAVRSGGHSAAGHSATEGGLVVDLRDMKAIDIDASSRTAWAEAGATAGEFTVAAAAHGLAVPFGDTGSVGLGGLVTGGGVGYLVRKLGLSVDALLAAEIVTADGTIREVDATREPELFWAIRGGGGNFGVVTRFRFKLSDLPDFTGGLMVLPATAENIVAFVEAASAAPEELSGIGNVMPAPPMPFLDASLHGKVVILAMLAWAGDAASGEKAMAPFRALGPLVDFVKPMPYPQIYGPEDPDYHPTAVSQNLFVERIDAAAAERIMHYLTNSNASLRVAQIRVLGGAYARIPAEATAYAHRGEPIMVNVAAFYDGQADKAEKTAWVADFAKALKPSGKAYVNFVADEGPARVRAAYPGATWDRLRAIKAKYDPHNFFRLNQNIPPA
jgi:FAD/FMN-containing dehydrogenase